MLNAATTGTYPNRIVIQCVPLTGPFSSAVTGSFDPTKDVKVYVDGEGLNITSYIFDSVNNRYLLFADKTFNLQGIVQVIHHMPNPPFTDSSSPPNTLGGFALTAIYYPT
jgi:hypothetical protein